MVKTENKTPENSVQSTTDPTGHESSEPKGQGEGENKLPKEIGGRDGPEPTRYGDWEKNGRCIDF